MAGAEGDGRQRGHQGPEPDVGGDEAAAAGALIALSQRNFLAAQVYGLILVAGLFSFLVNGLVAATEAYLFRHRPR